MSSASLPSSKAQYDVIKGGLGGGIAFIVLLILLPIFCITKFRFSKESFHTLLSVFYSSFEERQEHPQAAPPETATSQGAQAANPVLLIWMRNVPATDCNGCLTYTYYCLMAFMACMWFISFAVDNSIFLKATMCSDINPNDMSHVCFAVNESFKMVDCTAQQMEPVICYIFSLNFAGIGIAYSIATLCLAVADVYYVILMKMTLKCCWFIIVLRIIAFIGAVGGFILWWTIFQTTAKTKYYQYDYFGYGLVPMRISQSVLAFLTALIVIIAPPCKWNVNSMQSYLDLAAPYNIKVKKCDCCTCCSKPKGTNQGQQKNGDT